MLIIQSYDALALSHPNNESHLENDFKLARAQLFDPVTQKHAVDSLTTLARKQYLPAIVLLSKAFVLDLTTPYQPQRGLFWLNVLKRYQYTLDERYELFALSFVEPQKFISIMAQMPQTFDEGLPWLTHLIMARYSVLKGNQGKALRYFNKACLLESRVCYFKEQNLRSIILPVLNDLLLIGEPVEEVISKAKIAGIGTELPLTNPGMKYLQLDDNSFGYKGVGLAYTSKGTVWQTSQYFLTDSSIKKLLIDRFTVLLGPARGNFLSWKTKTLNIQIITSNETLSRLVITDLREN